eukprot:CAMPEP_0117014984 /NCGR_PEP_ID=MMETSP0472-20121206/12050_1 /TAXON_ID=693140 ORGANISM="Tiarina fusus, Strain LIS" /NCGR_SAMPLE_ID=MMETSP0472 /ASSEMBLY_ACC=CAM_ASM_000603 /LENGTH=146 /DNA_ID=CAMNT_0004718671 /DNA_START=452 /DNA_END=892 /DNA_ORIENTATION=+
MRMCFSSDTAVTGVAQAIIPYSEYAYDDGAYHIPMCTGQTAVGEDGVGLCSTGDIYVSVTGAMEDFTLQIFYDECRMDTETCYCNYAVIYFVILLVFLFSVGATVACLCCACCCTCCCWGACGIVTVIDATSRKRAESYPLVHNGV